MTRIMLLNIYVYLTKFRMISLKGEEYPHEIFPPKK